MIVSQFKNGVICTQIKKVKGAFHVTLSESGETDDYDFITEEPLEIGKEYRLVFEEIHEAKKLDE